MVLVICHISLDIKSQLLRQSYLCLLGKITPPSGIDLLNAESWSGSKVSVVIRYGPVHCINSPVTVVQYTPALESPLFTGLINPRTVVVSTRVPSTVNKCILQTLPFIKVSLGSAMVSTTEWGLRSGCGNGLGGLTQLFNKSIRNKICLMFLINPNISIVSVLPTGDSND